MKSELLKASTSGGVCAVLEDNGYGDGGVLYRTKLSERWASGEKQAHNEVASHNALRVIDRHREALGVAARRAVEEAEDVQFADEAGVVHPASD